MIGFLAGIGSNKIAVAVVPPSTDAILNEDGSYILNEDGSKILLG